MNSQPLVLVADDEPRITKLVALTLHDEGFRVVTAGGGEEALKKAEEVRPDIVLLDIVMPDLDGIEVMRQLREWRPVPVILLTAKGSTSDKAKGLDLGADDYIAKPFHPDELAARVRAVLRRASGVSPGAGIVAFDDIEIDLERQLLLVVAGGQVQWAFNTSTGNGEAYTSSSGGIARAATPPGSFTIGRQIDGIREAPLGTLYRPKYFNGGIAVHGSGSIPATPASHGCARLTNAAMDLLWSSGVAEIGTAVVVY